MKVQGIEFREGKSYIYLKISPERIKTSRVPGFSEHILQKLPGLKRHHCHNGDECTFARELEDTELAHAFEHILIELIAQKDPSVSSVKGWTNWDWNHNPRWTYEIEIYYDNRIIFLAALIGALSIIEGVIKTTQRVNYRFRADLGMLT